MNFTEFICFLSFIFCINLGYSNGSVIDVHRTAYHFQPLANLMSDPNGPMFYRGVYHLFYQYNPHSPMFDLRIVWGHSVSRDLINWEVVEHAIEPTKEAFDIKATWSGSATIVPGRGPVILYTGRGTNLIQVGNYAVPANLSDPYLRKWTKPDDNPIIIPDATVNASAFRDPSTAWWSDGYWRTLLGSRNLCQGVVHMYRSKDFFKWEKSKIPFDSSPGTGNSECPDFFPVAKSGTKGLDLKHIGNKNVRHVLKISSDWKRFDYYSLGQYDKNNERYIPDPDFIDGLQALRVDYGVYYASKSFFDSKTNRRIIWGYLHDTCAILDVLNQGWEGIQSIPRTVLLDPSGKQLVFWPVKEIERLRTKEVQIKNQKLVLGSKVEVAGVTAAQADVEVTFSIPSLEKAEPFNLNWTDPKELCVMKDSTVQGGIGPFGLITMATSDLEEHTPVFFRVFKGSNNKPVVLMCSDTARSTLTDNVAWPTYGGFVDIDLQDNKISLRSLIDHSVVESFGAKGKTCITSRIYPTKAVLDNAHLYVFNNGSEPITVESLKAWDMKRPTKMNN